MKKPRPSVASALDLIPGRSFSRAAAWLWLVRSSDDRGEVSVSSRKLAEQFGWTRSKTRRFLDNLTDCGMIQRLPRQSGPSEAMATICFGKDLPKPEENTGPSEEEPQPAARTIRAPSAPDKRLAFFAKLITSPDPVPEGAISQIMAQALVTSGAVTAEALRKKGVQA